MEFYEVKTAMKYSYYAHKDEWETSRYIAYLIAQVNSKRRINMKDMLPFSWEQESIDFDEPTKDDLERLKHKAEQFLKDKNMMKNTDGE